MTTKVCKQCQELKPLDEFGRHNRSPDLHKAKCMVCTGEMGAGSVRKQKNDPITPSVIDPAPELVTVGPSFEIPKAFGLRVATEDGTLTLEQDRPCEDGTSYTMEIVLQPHEARLLVEQIARMVEAA